MRWASWGGCIPTNATGGNIPLALADGATAQLVSPSDSNPKDIEMEDSDLNKNLFGIMNGGGEEMILAPH